MTRFDAGSPPVAADSFTSARGAVAFHPGIFLLSIVLAGALIAAACALLLVGQGAQYQLARTIDALQLSVFLKPQASRADAEALRGPIESIPSVAAARLRTREDAAAMLVGNGLSMLSTKPNPLPDVWVVSLRSPGEAGDASLPARVAEVRTALAALPAVESVRVDDRWVALLDRSAAWIGRVVSVATWTVSTALHAALLGVFFLTGRALSAGGRLGHDRLQALATVGMVAGLLSLALAGGLLLSVTALSSSSGDLWKPILDSIGRTGHMFVIAMGLAVVVIAAAGHALGGMHR